VSEPGDLCLSADERTGWDFWDERTSKPIGLPCADCTTAFAAEMAEAGLCNGSPVVRYCDRCKKWTPVTPDYWVIQVREAGFRADSRGRTYFRRTSQTTYTCRKCRQRQQRVYARKTLDPVTRHERRLASWRKYQAKRKALQRAERAAP
jgi:hypothetical protein